MIVSTRLSKSAWIVFAIFKRVKIRCWPKKRNDFLKQLSKHVESSCNLWKWWAMEVDMDRLLALTSSIWIKASTIIRISTMELKLLTTLTAWYHSISFKYYSKTVSRSQCSDRRDLGQVDRDRLQVCHPESIWVQSDPLVRSLLWMKHSVDSWTKLITCRTRRHHPSNRVFHPIRN